jgi:hypothetical protein
MDNRLDYDTLNKAFLTLGTLLAESITATINIVVCGGSSLIATGLVSRTTKDVDIVAILDSNKNIVAAQPLPEILLKAAGMMKTMLRMTGHERVAEKL